MMDTFPATIALAVQVYPPSATQRFAEIRALIFDGAEAAGVGPLTETLKWGEPAYLTQASKAGTTIRLAWKEAKPEHCGLFVHCQTSLVEGYRRDFPEAFEYIDNRAVMIPIIGDYPNDALAQIIARALTYHRSKAMA